MQTINNTESKIAQQAEITAAIIKKYRAQKFEKHAFTEQVDDLVFELLDCGDFEDTTYAYQDIVVTLLGLLARPDISAIVEKEVAKNVRTQITELLSGLYTFFKSLNDEYYTTFFELKWVKEYRADNNLEKLIELEKKYGSLSQ